MKLAYGIGLFVAVGFGVTWYISDDASTAIDALPVAQPKTMTQPKTMAPPPMIQPKDAPIVEERQQQPVAVSEQFSLVASAYAAELSAPSYSLPLQVSSLNAQAFVPQQVQMEGGGSVAIVPAKYRFTAPEHITAELVVTGFSLSEPVATIRHEWTGTELAHQAFVQQDGRWLIELKPDKHWDGQLEFSVEFQAQGEAQTLRTGIEYSEPVAWVLAVKDSFGEGADLVIPLEIEVLEAGDYRVRAQLFTDSGQPLAALVQEKKLPAGKQLVDMKAYKSVLQQHSGDFVIKAFLIEKRPSKPGDLTRYGASKALEFTVPSFAIGQLSDDPPEITSEEQQRLEFLKQLG